MKALVGVLAIVLMGNSLVMGNLVVTDNFDRENGYLGSGWIDTNSRFQVMNNQAVNGVAPGTDSMARINGIDVSNQPFAVQANTSSTGAGEFVGLAFNVQDDGNYYFARQMQNGGWTQVVEVRGGSYGSVFINESFPWNPGQVMSVSGNGAGTYTLTIGGQSRTFTDDTPLAGGSLGLYYTSAAGGGWMQWDNFSATYVPEPLSLSLVLSGLFLLRRRTN